MVNGLDQFYVPKRFDNRWFSYRQNGPAITNPKAQHTPLPVYPGQVKPGVGQVNPGTHLPDGAGKTPAHHLPAMYAFSKLVKF